jgi:hypothetical protein
MKKSIICCVGILIYCVPATAAENLIVNGDFEAGGSGFYSDYTANGLGPPGCYAIGPNPHNYHPGAVSYGDHTSGAGNMMIVNGATLTNCIVWAQTVEVSPHTPYEFLIWLSTWSNGGPPANLPCG